MQSGKLVEEGHLPGQQAEYAFDGPGLAPSRWIELEGEKTGFAARCAQLWSVHDDAVRAAHAARIREKADAAYETDVGRMGARIDEIDVGASLVTASTVNFTNSRPSR